MIRYEFSKDFQTWTSTIAGHDIHRDIIDGSYRVITGFTLQLNKHLTNSLSFSLVTDFATRKELMSYRYCRAYKNEQKVFTGILNSDSTTVIESVETVQLDIRYDDFNSLLKSVKVEKGKGIEYHEADGIKFLDPSDQTHSLVHILMNLLIAGNPEHNFTFTTDIDYLKQPILYYQLKEGADVLSELDEVFKENGLNYLLNEFAITLIDVMPQTTQGIIIPDIESEAKIQKTNFDDPVKVAPSEAVYYETAKNKYIYDDRDNSWFGKKWWWNTGYELKGGFRYDTDVTCTIPNDVKNHEAVEVKITEAVCGAIDGKKPDARFRRDYYTPDTKVYHFSGATGGSLGGSHHGSYILADITYKVTESIIKDKTIVDETLKPIRAKTVFTEASIKRYIESLKIRFALNDSWVFYAKEDLAIGDIVKVQDIEEYSQIRIYEKEDTDDIMGGAVYRAYPDTMPISEWDETLVDKDVEDLPDIYPIDIITDRQIIIKDGSYVADSQVFFLISKQTQGTPVVRFEGSEIPVFFDASPNVPADGESYSRRWYFRFSFYDTTIKNYTFAVTWGDSSTEKSFPVYRTVTAKDYPPIIQYAYSWHSDSPESKTSAFRSASRLFRSKNRVFISSGLTWTNDIPTGDKYKGMYLWKRTWSYELQKWIYERVTGDKGESAKLFEISAEQTTYNISNRGTPEQRINFALTVQNIEGTVVWSSSVGYFIDGTTTLILPPSIQEKNVEVSATLGDLVRKVVLSAIEINNEPIYLGIHTDDDIPEFTPTGGRLIAGDYYMTSVGVPMRWDGATWKEPEVTDGNYATIMDTCGKDWLLNDNDITPVTSALYAYFGKVYADAITTRDLTLTKDGGIKSENYVSKESGFQITAHGDAEFNDTTVRGTFINDYFASYKNNIQTKTWTGRFNSAGVFQGVFDEEGNPFPVSQPNELPFVVLSTDTFDYNIKINGKVLHNAHLFWQTNATDFQIWMDDYFTFITFKIGTAYQNSQIQIIEGKRIGVHCTDVIPTHQYPFYRDSQGRVQVDYDKFFTSLGTAKTPFTSISVQATETDRVVPLSESTTENPKGNIGDETAPWSNIYTDTTYSRIIYLNGRSLEDRLKAIENKIGL